MHPVVVARWRSALRRWFHFQAATLGKSFTHTRVPLSTSSMTWSGVELATPRRHQWHGISTYVLTATASETSTSPGLQLQYGPFALTP